MEDGCSWVMEMEKMERETDAAAEMALWSKHSIYKVPEWINGVTRRRAYVPFLVSLGPFHHGDAALAPMEPHKRRAMLHMAKRSGKPVRAFVAAVEAVAQRLEDAYEDIGEEWRAGSGGGGRAVTARFVQVMVTDGCFVVELMRMNKLGGMLRGDYPTNDPVFSEHGYLYLMEVMRSDVLLMENQLPLLLLQRLLAVQHGTTPDKTPGVTLGLHPLDIFHKSFCGVGQDYTWTQRQEVFMPSAVQLHEARVHFELRKSNGDNLQGVQFERGVLTMPAISVDNSSEKLLLNLMALEQLHPEAGNNVTAFVFFMDNIVDTAEDVALLKSRHILRSALGSDEEVAKLFNNTINKVAVMGLSSRLNNLYRQVNAHCSKPWNRWWASLLHTYFSNPWVFISLLVAFILLVATLMQTICSVMSLYKR
ncbi:UPF0481 protein At3g47200-like [Oryza brachyantha]|uniref:UPF0481 protein At3g47200-like n=1 Tax=Oryza brachyantha TaxID=4533 RepID=UPI001AD97C79|nr:UPF0481 protein At3g47200-like [Oryza brachyantha]